MGLFDKILKEVSEKAPDLKLDELAKNVSDAVSTLKTEAEKYAEEHKDAVGTVIPSGEDGPKPGAFGVSWGEEMPAEENLCRGSRLGRTGPFLDLPLPQRRRRQAGRRAAAREFQRGQAP